MSPRTCPVCGDSFEAVRGKNYCGKRCWPSRQPLYAPGLAEQGDHDRPGDRAELIELLWKAARKGSIAAMATLARAQSSDLRHAGPDEVTRSVIDGLADQKRITQSSDSRHPPDADDRDEGH